MLVGYILSIITLYISGILPIELMDVIAVILITYVFSLLPDIDHEISKITWMFLSIGAMFIIYGILYYKYISQMIFFSDVYMPNTFGIGIVMILVTIFFAKMPHRGLTHTIQFVILTPLLLFFIPNLRYRTLMIVIGVISGYSHLVLDGYLFKITTKPKKGMW